jgi:hypothetical protein
MTKRSLLLIASFCSFQIAHSQSRLENKAFKVDLGFAIGQQSPRETGFLMFAEPSTPLLANTGWGYDSNKDFFP